ncbi:hypothetical protein AGMMS50293_30510 [Spirochaetia bacterium]|nr:hypothetical protein AGMMS50293_30510 [Spirochaetia bacterium]
MSQTELLLKEVEGLSPQLMEELIDFAGYLKHKPSPAVWGNVPKNRSENPYKAIEELEGLGLAKGSKLTLERFSEMQQEDIALEEAQFRRLFHHEGAQ